MADPKLPPGMTLDPPASNTSHTYNTALPPGFTLDASSAAPPAPKPGILSRAWDWVNKGLVSGDTLLRGANMVTGGAVPAPEDIQEAAEPRASDSPLHAAARTFATGALKDTADTASSFTSPASIALLGAGAASKALPAAGTIAKAIRGVQGTAGAVYGAQGAKQVYDAATDDSQPVADRVQRGLIGGAMAAGGGAGAIDAAPSPRGMLSKRMTAGAPETPVANGDTGHFQSAMQQLAPGKNFQDLDSATQSKVLGEAQRLKTQQAPTSHPGSSSARPQEFTRGDIYHTAKQHGVNLDLADATESGPAQMAKKVVSRSLGGTKTFSNSQERNIGALNEWGNEYLDKLSPHSGEAAGSRVQQALQADLDAKKTQASNEFQDLDKRVGPSSIDGTGTVEAEAKKIVDQNKEYYDKHPQVMPKQAWSMIENLAKRPTVPIEQQVPGAGFGQPMNTVTKNTPAPTHQFSWNELHRLRSDFMDVYRNNPDITKGQGESWLQHMVKTIDDTMTGASSGLSPADHAQFRAANDIWENDIKGKYDNPQHPFYHAVRADFASQAPGMMGAKAPELARDINQTLGKNSGDFQRAVVEKIVGRDANGAADFKGMPSRLKQYSPEYLNSLLGPAKSQELYKMARIGRTLYNNDNPSGTSAVAIPAAEAGAIGASALHGNLIPALAPPLEYGTAKTMTSPRVVDFLTQPKNARRPGKVGPGSISSAMAAQQRR